MRNYIVLYTDNSLLPLDAPLGFSCEAEDTDHAEEQCINAYPDCYVVWVWDGVDMQDALDDYWALNTKEC